MATKRPKKDFIQFISDAEGDKKLLKDFLLEMTPKDLYSFFQKKEYDIPESDCGDIERTKRRMHRMRIPPPGEDITCPDDNKGY